MRSLGNILVLGFKHCNRRIRHKHTRLLKTGHKIKFTCDRTIYYLRGGWHFCRLVALKGYHIELTLMLKFFFFNVIAYFLCLRFSTNKIMGCSYLFWLLQSTISLITILYPIPVSGKRAITVIVCVCVCVCYICLQCKIQIFSGESIFI